METKIYELKLHQTIKIPTNGFDYEILRVAGGWIYTSGGSTGKSSVFVPFDNEFHAKIRRYNATKLKKSIDEKERYEKLGNMREYQTADSSNEAFERLYEAFLERNKDTSLVGSARFTPVRLQGDSVWAVIKEAGDSAAKSVLAECFREHEAVDWFSDMVFNALRKSPNENAIEIALYDLLSYLDFAETVTMVYAKMRRDLKPTKKLPFDDMSFESCYQDDEPFNKITQLLFDGLGAERPDINLYSAIERAGAIFFTLKTSRMFWHESYCISTLWSTFLFKTERREKNSTRYTANVL